jgi:O-antigen ligase
LTLFLTISRQTKAWRLLGAAGLLASILGIVGTQSRGGALALATAATFYWVFAVRRKTLGVVAFAIVITGVLATAPSQYWERLRTIQQYQEDNSARTRLQVWGAAVQMAVDYPLGVGANNFGSVYGRFYIPDDQNSMIEWGRNRWLSAHSVYFRLLGEYGVLGVVWVFLLLATNWRDNFATRARLASVPAAPGDGLPSEWPLILNMSLVGYAVSGIFLGGVTYPYLYLLSAWTASARWQSLRQKVSETEAASVRPLALATPAGPLGPRWTPLQPLGPHAVIERARVIMQKRPHAS